MYSRPDTIRDFKWIGKKVLSMSPLQQQRHQHTFKHIRCQAERL